jgi:hypothetical protein
VDNRSDIAQNAQSVEQLKDSVLAMGAAVVGIADVTSFMVKPPAAGLFAIAFG